MKMSILLALALCATAYPPHDSFPPPVIIKNEANYFDTRICKVPDYDDMNVDPEDTPSPLTVNECLGNGFGRDVSSCPKLNCSSECIVPDLDKRGCLASCTCKKSGLWGDIMLSESDVAMLESNRAGSRNEKRWNLLQGTTEDNKKYHIVYYTFAPSIGRKAANAINAAREAYFKDTCIFFYPKPADYHGDYIEFISDQFFCYSSLGRIGQGRQQISIGRGCEYKGIVMHEMMHAMGFWHEHSRPDRDLYVTINYNNIKRGTTKQFSKIASSEVNSFGSPYDMGSIMQYNGMSFTKNGRPTIVDKKSGRPMEGQRRGFSKQDIKQLRAMYNCDNL